MQLKILTFNIWDIPFWFTPKRHERACRLGEYLKKYDPDIICLQEAFDVQHRDELHEYLGKKTYHVTEGNGDTRRVLLFKRFDLTGGLVTFSKLPIISSRFVHFRRFVDMMFAEYIGRKGVLETIIKTPQGPFAIINTHLHTGGYSIDQKIRLRQMRQLFRAIKKRVSRIPIVITGDLNEDDIMQNESLSSLIKKFGFHDGADHSTNIPKPTNRIENPFTNAWFNLYKITSSQRVDYTLLNDTSSFGFKVIDHQVLSQPNDPLSDHDPLLITLSA
ncbi:MAG: endonuclease/exonuclease/phosphatase family protein [Patescibacteria group bacterium]|nr:endonuclease/exonuclease/phosphatase family protein [Patescibacteria group bacterium]